MTRKWLLPHMPYIGHDIWNRINQGQCCMDTCWRLCRLHHLLAPVPFCFDIQIFKTKNLFKAGHRRSCPMLFLSLWSRSRVVQISVFRSGYFPAKFVRSNCFLLCVIIRRVHCISPCPRDSGPYKRHVVRDLWKRNSNFNRTSRHFWNKNFCWKMCVGSSGAVSFVYIYFQSVQYLVAVLLWVEFLMHASKLKSTLNTSVEIVSSKCTQYIRRFNQNTHFKNLYERK